MVLGNACGRVLWSPKGLQQTGWEQSLRQHLIVTCQSTASALPGNFKRCTLPSLTAYPVIETCVLKQFCSQKWEPQILETSCEHLFIQSSINHILKVPMICHTLYNAHKTSKCPELTLSQEKRRWGEDEESPCYNNVWRRWPDHRVDGFLEVAYSWAYYSRVKLQEADNFRAESQFII